MVIEERASLLSENDTSESVCEQLKNHWRVFSPHEIARKLSLQNILDREGDARLHPFRGLMETRLVKQAREKPSLPLFPGRIIVLGPESKVCAFRKIAERHGGSVEQVPKNLEVNEGELHRQLKREYSFTEEAPLYTLRISGGKIRDVVAGLYSRGKAVFATDIVVLDPLEKILEKPESIDEARRTIIGLSENKVSVAVAVSCAIPLTLSGVGVNIMEGLLMELRLRHFSQEEVDAYLDLEGRKVMNYAGAIDYSGEAGQALLDSNEAIKVMGIRRGVLSLLEPEVSPVLVPLSAAHVLDFAFKGAPEFLIEPLYLQAKGIQEYDLESGWSKDLR